MKLKISVLLSLFFVWGMTSCIDDESDMGGRMLPQLEITDDSGEKMPVKNFDLGSECVITPNILYKGGDEKKLTYEWSIGTYLLQSGQNPVKGPLEVVSTERVLKYKLQKGGTYYAHLKVSDGLVGIIQEYQININRPFEDGYVLTSNKEDGKGNMVFIKIMTPEEIQAGKPQVIQQHSLEYINGEDTPVKGLLGTGFKVDYSGKATLYAVAEDRVFFLDPNTFYIENQSLYSDVISNFKAGRFNSDCYAPFIFDAEQKKYIHLETEQKFLYENSKFVNVYCDDIFVGNYTSGYGCYNLYIVDYENDELGDYHLNYGQFNSTGDYFRKLDMDIVSAYVGPEFLVEVPGYPEYNYSDIGVYVLCKSKSDNQKYAIYSFENVNTGSPTLLNTKEFTPTADMALPVQGTKFFYSQANSRYFYSQGNCVYVHLPNSPALFPDKTEYAIRYGENEEVTCMKVNRETEELYVATYDKVKKNGSFYIYDTVDVSLDNQATIQPKESFLDCADKIVDILRKTRS